MKLEITSALINEHKLILRMLTVLENRAELTSKGKHADYRFYLDAVDFIRNFADRFHHAKEEDILFEALVKNGMPRENSPVAAMLMEHVQGRVFVSGMEEAAHEALAGKLDKERDISENANGYLNLLREHIDKEDNILYPLAERLIPVDMREGIVAGYRAAEEQCPAGFKENYRKIVEKYESEMLDLAA